MSLLRRLNGGASYLGEFDRLPRDTGYGSHTGHEADGLRRDDAPRRAARQQLVRPAAVDRTVGPDGGQPDPRPSRRAAAGLARQARPPRDRGREQPVRPDPLRCARAARDGAPDRPAAAAGAARGAHRRQLLLVAAPSGAPLHQPRRLARLRLRQLRGRPGEGAARPGRRAGQGDRRRRLRPAPDLRRQAVRARALRRRADPRRSARQRGGGDAARQGARVARPAAVQPAPARCARAARAADVRARLPVRRLGPGDRHRVAARRRRGAVSDAPAPRRRRAGDEHPDQALARAAQALRRRPCRR